MNGIELRQFPLAGFRAAAADHASPDDQAALGDAVWRDVSAARRDGTGIDPRLAENSPLVRFVHRGRVTGDRRSRS